MRAGSLLLGVVQLLKEVGEVVSEHGFKNQGIVCRLPRNGSLRKRSMLWLTLKRGLELALLFTVVRGIAESIRTLHERNRLSKRVK